MNKKDLHNQLSVLGFPLFETERTQDVNHTIAEVVKSKDLRLWEGFPVILATGSEKHLYDYKKVTKYLNKSEITYFDSLIMLSLALYKIINFEFSWSNKYFNILSENIKKDFPNIVNQLGNNTNIKLGNYTMNTERLKSIFNNYYTIQKQTKLTDLLSMKEQYGLEYALSQLFSGKQKELFVKKLTGEKLTKTEKEYFSRAVKKKVVALSNPELHRLAQKLLE